MGRQVNFFLHPDDQTVFDTVLKSFGDIVLLPYYHHENKISTVNDTLIRNVSEEGSRIYLIRKEDFKDIKLHYISKFNYWFIEDNKLPVLHFDRCILKDNKINRGRLYFQPQYVEDSKWVKKSDDFINWSDNIIKTVRRKLKKYKYHMGKYDYFEYMGENALKWLIENKAEIGAGGLELISIKN